MMQGLEWDPRGRVRRPIGRSGDYVRLTGGRLVDGKWQWPERWKAQLTRRPAAEEYVTLNGRPLFQLPDPVPDGIGRMVEDLVRRFDPGGYRLACPVAGCSWQLDVPRMELDPEPLDAGAGDWVAHVEAVPREDVELVLRTHLDWHAALTETGAADVPLPLKPDCEGVE